MNSRLEETPTDEENAWWEVNAPALARKLLAELSRRDWKLSCAESLTGGMIASTIVGIPGASEVLLGGVVTYTDAIKTRVLGVDMGLLETHTAYSAECAEAMARGARNLFGAEVAISSTGVAGPGSDLGVSPGRGFLGCITPETSLVWPVRVSSDLKRFRIRQAFTRGALALLQQVLLSGRA